MAERRRSSPKEPPFYGRISEREPCRRLRSVQSQSVAMAADSVRDLWDKLFAQGYKADVSVHTNGGFIPAHASILGMVSPVMKQMLRQSKSRGSRRKSISIRGVPHRAVWVFLRFLYSSCYEEEEMNQYVLHLLVLSHVFGIPSLKKLCVEQLEKGLLTVENAVDVFQLGQLCDAPRLSLLCHRIILRDFHAVSSTLAWKVLKQSNPSLEKELLQSVVEAHSHKRKERLKKTEEMKIYMQLHEAMEALVHICRDGCRTIGPHDKVLKRSAAPCNYPACKGLESLVRHFAGCKKRVLGGCSHCKRMWQLLELHSRLCGQSQGCKVPLCKHFKDKSRRHNKEEVKWGLLVEKVMEASSYSVASSPQSVDINSVSA